MLLAGLGKKAKKERKRARLGIDSADEETTANDDSSEDEAPKTQVCNLSCLSNLAEPSPNRFDVQDQIRREEVIKLVANLSQTYPCIPRYDSEFPVYRDPSNMDRYICLNHRMLTDWASDIVSLTLFVYYIA